MTKAEKQKRAEKKARLVELENKLLASYYANSIRLGAEEHIEYYRKNTKAFKLLLQSEVKTNVAMRRYFRELGKRAIDELNWNEYERKIANAPHGANLKAGILDYLVQAFWENETLVLKIFLTKSLVDALEGGGLFTEDELKIDVGWSRDSHPAIEFFNKYSLDLAKGLTQTTKKRITAALATSIDNGEDRNAAVARLLKTINDPVRATTIAQTESVRAFSSGRMEVGRQVGADRKSWRSAGDAKVTQTCLNNERLGVVPFDYKYRDYAGEKITEPPAHPNCRSGIVLYMPGEKV